MASKRLKIENLDNLQELNSEEVSPIQGGGAELKAPETSVEPENLIYPLPVWPWPPYPCKPYRIKDKDGEVLLHHCPVIL